MGENRDLHQKTAKENTMGFVGCSLSLFWHLETIDSRKSTEVIISEKVYIWIEGNIYIKQIACHLEAKK